MNLREAMVVRAQALRLLREFFHQHDFLEIETPVLVKCPGTEVHLQYFRSEWETVQGERIPLYLRSSPELHLKQSLAMGLPKVFHLAKCFRNRGELADWHHPEFSMLEFYQTQVNLSQLMELTYSLMQFIQEGLKDRGIDCLELPQELRKISVFEAYEEFLGIKLIDGDPDLARKARDKGLVSVQAEDDFETAYFKIQLDFIEPRLKEWTAAALYDYPASQAALAQIHEHRAQRFEIYLNGIELCNAFHELLDPDENLNRLQQSHSQRQALHYETVPLDEDFVEATRQGLPDCCGNAMGFDRLLALLLQHPSLDLVTSFRWNRPYHRGRSPFFGFVLPKGLDSSAK